MTNCIYCNKPAGIFRSKHKDCIIARLKGEEEIINLVNQAGLGIGALKQLKPSIDKIAHSIYIVQEEIKDLIIQGWEKAVEDAFDDGILTSKEERALQKLSDYFSLSQEDLDERGAYERVVKGAVIKDVLDGEIPDKVEIEGHTPFNFLKSEQLVWLFLDVDYYEANTRTHYIGGSPATSTRIFKGVYYRVGGFKGERVQTSEDVHVDTGLLGITDKHIYFAGHHKRFRIKYEKIVTFEPYSDGIEIQRDALTAKPQSFITDDGWFTYNLITNLARI